MYSALVILVVVILLENIATVESVQKSAESDNTSKVIKLSPKDIKSWKSQTEKIKEWVLYGFALFCLIVLIWLIKFKQQ